MAKRPLASMALGVAVLLLLVACGGGSPTETTVAAAFTALAEKAQEATYRFDYKIIGPTGEVQQTGTLYRKPPKFRLDGSFGSPAVRFATIITPKSG